MAGIDDLSGPAPTCAVCAGPVPGGLECVHCDRETCSSCCPCPEPDDLRKSDRMDAAIGRAIAWATDLMGDRHMFKLTALVTDQTYEKIHKPVTEIAAVLAADDGFNWPLLNREGITPEHLAIGQLIALAGSAIENELIDFTLLGPNGVITIGGGS